MRYPGGKGQAGVFQRIISLMPPHDVYIETHLGGGNILERKRPARSSIGIDIDEGLCAIWKAKADRSTSIICGDAAAFIRSYKFNGRELVYCDPPYVRSTRKGGRLYRHEYTDAQHAELASLLSTVRTRVMISGYRHAIYDDAFATWRRIDFDVMTRGHSWATESLWLNFEPAALHDYRFIGGNFRERERIKRKRQRWRDRLAQLPASERAAMLEELIALQPAVRIDRNDDTGSGAVDPIAILSEAAGMNL